MRPLRHLFYAMGYGLLGSFLVLVGGYAYLLESRPDLKIWHNAELDAEFSAEKAAQIRDLDDYRALEDRLFAQLEKRVYTLIEPSDRRQLNRYSTGSRMDPKSFPHNWNRTFELIPEEPLGGILLLHGLSDSPYSLRTSGQRLHEKGFWVVGLRLPGHGTAPSGVLQIEWADWAAAVRIAARHLRDRIGPQRPFYMIGYSNGAALAVEYAVSVLEGAELPSVSRLILLSPAIAVSKVAALAIWQSRLSWLAGLDKLAWNSIEPEFDPYKYNSFTVNAGDQIYRLTQNISGRIERLRGPEGIMGFPSVLAFMSVMDATIPPKSLIDALFSKLATDGHELVLFDINRHAETEALLKSKPDVLVNQLLSDTSLNFDLTLITNVAPDSDEMVARKRKIGFDKDSKVPLKLSWPNGVFSLSHVALPFPPHDPVYGSTPDEEESHPWIALGSIAIRGERGLLLFPDSYFMRLRYNPFYSYMAKRIERFVEIDTNTKKQR